MSRRTTAATPRSTSASSSDQSHFDAFSSRADAFFRDAPSSDADVFARARSPYPAILCAILLSFRYLVSANTFTASAPASNRKSFRVFTTVGVVLSFEVSLPSSSSAFPNAAHRALSVLRCLKFEGDRRE